MPNIPDAEWAALVAHIDALEAENELLARERFLLGEGRHALKAASRPAGLISTPPAGFGRGRNGQLVALTYEAAVASAPDWFKTTPRKRAKTPSGYQL
ncbi:hypothetical protein [Methylobacterium sp. ID0610]|uniref:hypothetical protein n=1 Tax=Methylobacterium carpenticola TaxID=3344827 RepID=UPI003681CB7A